jgi:hypothetical protein
MTGASQASSPGSNPGARISFLFGSPSASFLDAFLQIIQWGLAGRIDLHLRRLFHLAYAQHEGDGADAEEDPALPEGSGQKYVLAGDEGVGQEQYGGQEEKGSQDKEHDAQASGGKGASGRGVLVELFGCRFVFFVPCAIFLGGFAVFGFHKKRLPDVSAFVADPRHALAAAWPQAVPDALGADVTVAAAEADRDLAGVGGDHDVSQRHNASWSFGSL